MRLSYVASVLTLTLLCSQGEVKSKGFAGEESKETKTEVFYATDRAYSPSKGYEGLRAFTNDCRHSLLVGKASISNSSLRYDDSKVAKAKVRITQQGTINKGEIAPAFSKELYEACREKRLILFVHGTNTKFDDAARAACKLSFCSGLPVLLFSWPSVGGLSNYQIDEANCEWSTFHFSGLLNYLEDNCILSDKGSSIVAHSLGNRVLIWARSEIGKFRSIKELLFVCPDIDGETFKHYVSGFSGDTNLKYKLLFSRNDKALAFSQLLHGGYYRIGGAVDTFIGSVSNPRSVLELGTHVLSRSKDFFSEKKDRVEVAESSELVPIEGIEFTRLDKGVIGHKLPYNLIGACLTGSIQEQYVTRVKTVSPPSKFTRFCRWLYEIPAEPVSVEGNVTEVVNKK